MYAHKTIIRCLVGCAAASVALLPVGLFAFPIDVTEMGEPVTVSIPTGNNCQDFELYNFSENTIYVLRFDGTLLFASHGSEGVYSGENNTLLIEHESSLLDGVQRVFAACTDRTMTIHKMAVSTDLYPHLGNGPWGKFIDSIRNRIEPRKTTRGLVELTQDAPLKHVLTIGCESGEDPLYLAAQGTDVTIIDATPHAIGITMLRMMGKNLEKHLKEALVCKIEDAPKSLGTFDAVTGGQVFSFIPPEQFSDVMSTTILPLVGPQGYFSGCFFGPEHDWADKPEMTFVTQSDLITLFESNGFDLIELNEIKIDFMTVLNGPVWWHEYEVIARRRPLTIITTGLHHEKADEIIQQVLDLQGTLIVNNQETESLPASFEENGFLTLRWTADEVMALLDRGGKILTVHDDKLLVGYLLLDELDGYFDWLKGRSQVDIVEGWTLDELEQFYIAHQVKGLQQIGVATAYAQRGIGNQLVTEAKKLAPGGMTTDILYRPFTNHASLAFFAKQGFKHIGTVYTLGKPPKYLPHEIYMELWMP